MSESGKNLAFRGVFLHRHGFAFFRLPLWGLIALAAALISLGGFAFHGFDENGLRFGNQLAWRFAFFVYFAAIIAGPLTRLIPSGGFRRPGVNRRQLVWGFCASFGVYLASLIVPNIFMPPTLEHQGFTIGMALFAIFGTVLTIVVAYAASPQSGLNPQSRRAILGAGLSYFWLAYILTGLSRLSNPHRPDAFYGLSVMLILMALLMRLTENLIARKRAREQRSQH